MATRKRNPSTAELAVEAAEPEAVLVVWLRDTSHAASEGGCHIGPRHYQGRVGEQAEIRADDAAILAANGYAQYGPKAPSVEGPAR